MTGPWPAGHLVAHEIVRCGVLIGLAVAVVLLALPICLELAAGT
ncbi:MAG TPA: hypothetical protein VFJ71_01795 [Candidatus Limnocylindrales bacterium]|nr:hypothetical protein [Candidatus Limnocylindrales bacterium]